MWRPRTLLEAIEADEAHELIQCPDGRFACPQCGALRAAAAIVDVTALPIPESWACDCCWTGWQRTGRVIDGGPAIANHKQWRIRWAAALGAPSNVRTKMLTARDPAGYGRQRTHA